MGSTSRPVQARPLLRHRLPRPRRLGRLGRRHHRPTPAPRPARLHHRRRLRFRRHRPARCPHPLFRPRLLLRPLSRAGEYSRAAAASPAAEGTLTILLPALCLATCTTPQTDRTGPSRMAASLRGRLPQLGRPLLTQRCGVRMQLPSCTSRADCILVSIALILLAPSHSALVSCNLTGTLPDSLGSLTTLDYLCARPASLHVLYVSTESPLFAQTD